MPGGSKPAGNTTTTTKSDPWEGQQQYLRSGFGEADKLYNSGGLSPDFFSGYTTPATGRPSASLGTGLDPSVDSGFLSGAGDMNSRNDQFGAPTWQVVNAMKQLGYGAPGQTTATAWDSIQKSPDQLSRMNQLMGKEGVNVGTVAPFSDETNAAHALTTGRALAGSPVTNQAKELLTDTMGGRYLMPGSNPFLDANVGRALDSVRGQVNSSFASGGGFGGSANQEILARELGKTATEAYGKNYDTERGRQMQSMLFAPQMANQDYIDFDRLSSVGAQKEDMTQSKINEAINQFNLQQESPYTALQRYSGLIGGNYGGTTAATQPYFRNKTGETMGMLGQAADMGSTAYMAYMLPSLIAASDVRLKENIIPLGTENGFPVYEFSYKGNPARFIGVMAQEVQKLMPQAVGRIGRWLAVNYSMIGVKFREAA